MTRDARKQRSEVYRSLLAELSAILFRHDPMRIAFADNPGEYAPEAGTILARLTRDLSMAEGAAIVHEELRRWFGEETVGPQEQYTAIAAEMLAAVRQARWWAA